MTDKQLLKWIQGIYKNTVEQKSGNAGVEWDRNIPEAQEDLTEEQIKYQDPEFKDRPQKCIDL